MQYFSLKQKLRLAQSLFTKTSPAYVQYYITARCNLTCEQCNIIYADATAEEMNITQIQRMAENFAEMGVCIVLLIGGEPFVRRDLPQIVKAFTDVDIHVRMQTNGLARRKDLEECAKNGGHDISISLDSLKPSVQDTINGGFNRSWQRAIETVAMVNEIFPENGSAFFGTVLMPRNLYDIPDVVRFATRIGWGVSLVPAHATTPDRPRGFRTFDDGNIVSFQPEQYPEIKKVIGEIKDLKKKSYNIYDSNQYLDDIYRFITGEELHWRRRNGGVCDSPNLYFAVAPNGNLKVCCDYHLQNSYPVYHPEFPDWYWDGKIHNDVYSVTESCEGCMYGSYPEITITARYLENIMARFKYFNMSPPKLQKLNAQEMTEIAVEIVETRNSTNSSNDAAKEDVQT